MCGIFGFVSQTDKPASLILEGLKTLEYHGYDSWGISVKKQKTISNKQETGSLLVEKHVGKIGNATTLLPQTTLGIGHTRWATHGGVTVANAHPHLDCTKTLAVVHNGIFENYEREKEKLIKKGHKFVSETDTEVVAHMVEEDYKTQGFATSVRNTFNKIKGLNAFVFVNAVSKEIVVVKNGSPLIIGVTRDALYLSSDISAFSSEVKQIVILKDNQMAILGEKLKVFSLPNGREVKFVKEKLRQNKSENLKGKFAHFILKEIYDQPKIVRNIAKTGNVDRIVKDIKNAFGTYMLGCGTGSYAAMAGEYFLSKIAKKHINFSVGSEFKYLQNFITKKSLVIPISQSGETIDVVEPVQQAKLKGADVVPIVNVPTSTLARLGNYSLLLNAGHEKAVVATKSFTAMVGLLFYISYGLAKNKNEGERILTLVSDDVKKILSDQSQIKKLAKYLKTHERIFTIGRGISYVAALEAAMKLKETALIHAEGFAGGELKHGVIALIEKGTPCIVFAPNDETYSDIVSNAAEIKARGGFIIGVGPIKNSVFDVFLKTADAKEATLISQTVYMQLLAYYLALERGIEDPDKPRNLAKSVTVK